MVTREDDGARSVWPRGAFPEATGDDGRSLRAVRPTSIPQITEEDVIGFDALWEAMDRCSNGVKWKDSVARFRLNAAEEIGRLCDELHAGTYRPSPPTHFMVTYPKPRPITAITFRDRIYQRSLADNCVYPIMAAGLIHDNVACQEGKGTDAGRERFARHIRREYLDSGTGGSILSADVKGYYDNMPHSVAEEKFRRKLPGWAYERVADVLRAQYPGDVGYEAGSQLVQIAGISVLDDIDHRIKERLRVRGYVRYMDDFRLIHADADYLRACLADIERELSRIGFKLNRGKTRIAPITERTPFLGFTFRLTGSGKVVREIIPAKEADARRRLRRMAALVKEGKRPLETAEEMAQAHRSHLENGTSRMAIARFDDYCSSLWKEIK